MSHDHDRHWLRMDHFAPSVPWHAFPEPERVLVRRQASNGVSAHRPSDVSGMKGAYPPRGLDLPQKPAVAYPRIAP
eukprot:11041958-Alexandrium_andersonii.AAC.1